MAHKSRSAPVVGSRAEGFRTQSTGAAEDVWLRVDVLEAVVRVEHWSALDSESLRPTIREHHLADGEA